MPLLSLLDLGLSTRSGDVHEQVLGKFCLEMTEEQAIEHFERLLNDISPFTAVLDRMHDWAQYWRS